MGTLLGLLGTIVGLIAAFASVSDPVEKSVMLTKGISMAMNTTAYGLIMAIPTLMCTPFCKTDLKI
ncbi:MAG: MotA/TolQ/ExbB proton channel family protein [Bdellovibrionales bacterium]